MSKLNKIRATISRKAIPVMTSVTLASTMFMGTGLTAFAANLTEDNTTHTINYSAGTDGTGSLDPGSTTTSTVTISDTETPVQVYTPVTGSFTKSGYTFDDSYTVTNGSVYASDATTNETAITKAYVGTSYIFTTDATLTAIYKGNTINLTYDYADGTKGTTNPTEKTYGTALTDAISVPTKTGYTFAGWDLDGDDTADIDASANTSTQSTKIDNVYADNNYTDDITLTALWTENTYTLALEMVDEASVKAATDWALNSSDNSIVKRTDIKYSTEFTLPTPRTSSSLKAYTQVTVNSADLFLGWDADTSYDSDGDGINTNDVDYTAGQKVSKLTSTDGATVTLTAVYKDADPAAATITLTDGASTDDNETITVTGYSVGDKYVLPENTFTYADYTFNAWEVNSTSYDPGDEITLTATTTVTATWTADKYTITYDYNGGRVTDTSTTAYKSSQTLDYNTNITFPTPTYTGYTLLGWSTSKSATTPTYYIGELSSITAKTIGNTTLYAIWAADTDKITIGYDAANDGADKTRTVAKGSAFTIDVKVTHPTASTNYSLYGYTAGTYYADIDAAKTAKATIYKVGDSYTASEDTTFYALYEAATYTLTFDGNGADSGSIADITTKYSTTSSDMNVKLPENAFVRSGYTFKEYNTTSAGNGTSYAEKATYPLTENAILYAIWTANSYRILGMNNGSKMLLADSATASDTTTTLNACTFEAEDGYEFAGWSSTDGATEAEFEDKATYAKVIAALGLGVEDGEDIILYAVWEKTDVQKAADAQAAAEEEAANAKSAQAAAEADKAAAEGKLSAYLSDGSSAGIPAAVGSELKNDGQKTGFVVTNATAGSATVEYKGTSDDKLSTSITIPSTVKDASGNEYKVTSIAKNAFAKDTRLKTVVIPSTVTSIGKNAFKSAKNVKKITINANANLKVGKNAFKNLKKGSKIVVKGISGSAKKKLVKKIKKQVTASKTTVK